MTENSIATRIVDMAYKIHTTLGPGLLESVYESALAWDLEASGHKVLRQHPVPIIYKGVHIQNGFVADLIVDDKVILELKAVELILDVHKKQLLTYLRLTDKRLGLLNAPDGPCLSPPALA